MQYLNPTRTTWHITFGTYGTRLHGSVRPTADKQHNQRGTPFLSADGDRFRFERQLMNTPSRQLRQAQRHYIEQQIEAICERGGWNYRICAAATDHVHLLCDVVPEIHGEKVRRLIKRWLGQALSNQWPLIKGERWWADEGSNKAVKDESYLNNAHRYILRQRSTTIEAPKP